MLLSFIVYILLNTRSRFILNCENLGGGGAGYAPLNPPLAYTMHINDMMLQH